MHKNVKEIETVLEKDSVFRIKIQVENRGKKLLPNEREMPAVYLEIIRII